MRENDDRMNLTTVYCMHIWKPSIQLIYAKKNAKKFILTGTLKFTPLIPRFNTHFNG
jgi:hypothetical protein